MAQEIKIKDPQQDFMPLLPLRDVVVYPHLVIPLFVGRTKSVKALEIASDKDKKIILVAQKSASNFASVCAKSVFPEPVGPIRRILLFEISTSLCSISISELLSLSLL